MLLFKKNDVSIRSRNIRFLQWVFYECLENEQPRPVDPEISNTETLSFLFTPKTFFRKWL